MPDENDEDYMADRRDEVSRVVGKLIARAWADEAFKRALLADPQPLLKAEGLFFPERYVIEFHDDPSAELGDWSSIGRDTKAIHRFPIPPRPGGEQLTYELLEGAEAGRVACCSPCASCTGAVGPGEWR